MNSIMYMITVPLYIKGLRNLKSILEKAVSESSVRGVEIEYLLSFRLYPDQYPLYRQVRCACLEAKNSVSVLTGIEAPKFRKDETGFNALMKNIETAIGFLGILDARDFEHCSEKAIPIAFKPGKFLSGYDYITQMTLPNFYFHITTAYSILRHNGLSLGKKDYLGELDFEDKSNTGGSRNELHENRKRS